MHQGDRDDAGTRVHVQPGERKEQQQNRDGERHPNRARVGQVCGATVTKDDVAQTGQLDCVIRCIGCGRRSPDVG